MTEFSLLAAPLHAGRLRLKNRIAHAAILTRFAAGERTTDRLIGYHANRAAGGAALIVTEAVNALPSQAGRGAYLNAHSDDGIPDLARLADAVSAHDCRVMAQLQERGRGNYAQTVASQAFGPSALPDDIAGAVPHALTTSDVECMIDDFAAAAHRLERAGFDGVELSAGHGHLFHQFLSGHANRRTDRFGGDLTGRMAFLAETVAAIRSACGPAFAVGLKLPADDGDPNGIDLSLAAEIADALAKPADIDLLSFAWGAQNRRLHWHVPDGHAPRAVYAADTAKLRAAANGVATMALGRIVDPNEAEAILAAGQADLVAVGRGLIADPMWPAKALSGRAHAIRACVSCNTCWGAIAAASSLVCDTNPDLGLPAEIAPPPKLAKLIERRKTVIVGGGVSGLAMAAAAVGRGDDVTLFHGGADLGGKAWVAARLPGGEGLQGVYDDEAARALAAGARFELGVQATVADVLSLSPDRVGLATGAAQPWPDDDLFADPEIAPPLSGLLRRVYARPGRIPGRLALIDGEDSIWVYRATELLAGVFESVVVVTERERPAGREPLVVRQGLLERLACLPVSVETFQSVDPCLEEIAEGQLGLRHVLSGERRVLADITTIAHASPRQPRLDLQGGLKSAGISPILIGDAFQPRSLLHAVGEGRAAGRA